MLGFAESPFAENPFAIGVTEELAAPNRNLHSARVYDPIDRDFTFDSSGFTKESPVRERIKFLLTNSRGSAAALPTLGSGVGLLGKIDDSFVMRVKNDVQQSLSPLTSANDITIESIDVLVSAFGKVEVQIKYTEVKTNNSDIISI